MARVSLVNLERLGNASASWLQEISRLMATDRSAGMIAIAREKAASGAAAEGMSGYGHSPTRSPVIFTREAIACPPMVICVRTSAE